MANADLKFRRALYYPCANALPGAAGELGRGRGSADFSP